MSFPLHAQTTNFIASAQNVYFVINHCRERFWPPYCRHFHVHRTDESPLCLYFCFHSARINLILNTAEVTLFKQSLLSGFVTLPLDTIFYWMFQTKSKTALLKQMCVTGSSFDCAVVLAVRYSLPLCLHCLASLQASRGSNECVTPSQKFWKVKDGCRSERRLLRISVYEHFLPFFVHIINPYISVRPLSYTVYISIIKHLTNLHNFIDEQ